MNSARSASVFAMTFGLGLMLFSCWSCSQITHVPPGQSVAFSTAPKPDVVSTRKTKRAEIVATAGQEDYYLGPAVEPELPVADFTLPDELASVETASTFATQGSDYLARGNTNDAIDALKKAVELEPHLSTAWRDLAIAYENANQPAKAREARENFKRYGGL